MKKEKLYAYRIKDLQTGLYYQKEYWQMDIERNKELLKECQYTYYANAWGDGRSARYLKFTQHGLLFRTKLGAERKISGFNGNSVHDRTTPAARILRCKFNFVVVKTEVKYKDVEK